MKIRIKKKEKGWYSVGIFKDDDSLVNERIGPLSWAIVVLLIPSNWIKSFKN
jgi:hypothetical protein